MDAHAPPASLVRRAFSAGLVAGLLALFVRTFVVQLIVVESGSMEPTLLVGDFVLIDRLAYAAPRWMLAPGRAPRAGDVLLFRQPRAANERWVKRCVAVAGDEVEVEGERIWNGGRLVPAPTAADSPRADGATAAARRWTIPPGSIFLAGDHRAASMDSRAFGPVPLERALGRAVCVLGSRSPENGILWRRFALPVR